MALYEFFTRERKQLKGEGLPVWTLNLCCVKHLERADCPVCMIGWENRKDHEIEASVASVEHGVIHFTSFTLTQYSVNY